MEAGVESTEIWVLGNRRGEVEVPRAVSGIRAWFCCCVDVIDVD